MRLDLKGLNPSLKDGVLEIHDDLQLPGPIFSKELVGVLHKEYGQKVTNQALDDAVDCLLGDLLLASLKARRV